jgi:hypothetical protein
MEDFFLAGLLGKRRSESPSCCFATRAKAATLFGLCLLRIGCAGHRYDSVGYLDLNDDPVDLAGS